MTMHRHRREVFIVRVESFRCRGEAVIRRKHGLIMVMSVLGVRRRRKTSGVDGRQRVMAATGTRLLLLLLMMMMLMLVVQ